MPPAGSYGRPASISDRPARGPVQWPGLGACAARRVLRLHHDGDEPGAFPRHFERAVADHGLMVRAAAEYHLKTWSAPSSGSATSHPVTSKPGDYLAHLMNLLAVLSAYRVSKRQNRKRVRPPGSVAKVTIAERG